MSTIRTTADFGIWIADALRTGLLIAGRSDAQASAVAQASAEKVAAQARGIARQYIAAKQAMFLEGEITTADGQEAARLLEVTQLLAFYAATPDGDPGKYTAEMAERDRAGIRGRAEDARAQAQISASEMARDAELIEEGFQVAFDYVKANAAELCK